MPKSALRAIAHLGSPLGITGYNLYLFRSLKRPEWIYRAKGKVPSTKLTFLSTLEVTPQDILLCERLICAYQKSLATFSEEKGLSGLWSENIRRHYRKLLDPLQEGNARLLASALSSMFKEGFLYGIASGDQYKQALSRLGSRIWSMKCLDDVVSLAEYLGIVRTECPEQGVLGYAFKDGLEQLVDQIEKALGIPIGFPEVGGAYGVGVGQKIITMEAPEHIYAALRLNQAIHRHLPSERAASPGVVEIGAGFGGTAHWFLKLRHMAVRSYTIIDLPLVNVLQGYFLSKAFGEPKVALFGEDRSPEKLISVFPMTAIQSLGEGSTDVLINENSMPEMPEQVVLDYISWARKNVRDIFYSYNQEAYSPVNGVPQVLVPEAVSRVGGFKLLSRNASWVRRGYVEEIYSCVNA